MDYIGDFFTVTVPDATYLHCWRLINVVPRLQEIAAYMKAILYPFEAGLTGWNALTDEQKTSVFEYILNADWSGLQDYLETLFPTEPPSNIEALIEQYLYGYYNLAVASANTLAIEIVASEYEILPEGTIMQYKPTRTTIGSSNVTLGQTYVLERWEHRIFDDGSLAYEVWGEFWYRSINEDIPTWQYARSTAEAVRDSKYGAIMTLVYYSSGAFEGSTHYVVSYEDTYWATIGSRRETFLPLPDHYYDHYVDPSLIITTDPVTRGGIYSAYGGLDWEYHTDHPETMGNPWAGDEGERPYDDDLYNWISQTINPPGYTDLIHEFLLTVQATYIIGGYGKDPAADPRPVIPTSGGLPLGLTGFPGSVNPLGQLSPFRRRRVGTH